MPQVFKALSTILAWVLWLSGMLMGFSVFVMGIIAGDLYNPAQPVPMSYWIGFAVSLGYGVGATVVMLLRKKLE